MIINNQKEQTNLKTSVTYKGNGTQKQFDFPFDYLRKAFVKVSVNDAIVDGYTIDNRSVIFNIAPASNDVIVIYRETTTERLVSWADASVLKATDMTISQVQQLHILEEGKDWSIANSMVLNGDNEWEGRNHKIVNVVDPTTPQGVVTKHYMETVQGGFVQQNEQIKNEATKQAQLATQKAKEADTSAKAAKASEGVASTKATEATEQAQLAKWWAQGHMPENNPSNQSAKEWAKASEIHANIATEKAELATQKATESLASANKAKENADAAKTSAAAAKSSETAAKSSETKAKASETAAKSSETKAKASETNAKASETNASNSANTATTKASEASASANQAMASADRADTAAQQTTQAVTDAERAAELATSKALEAFNSANTATTKASEASTSAAAAKASETKAKASETNAGTSANKATTEANRAKTEADRAKTAADSVGNPVVSITQSGGNLTVTKGDGSSNTLTVTPAKASQAEAEAGTDDTKMMTPLRVKESIKANAPIKSVNGVVAGADGNVSVGLLNGDADTKGIKQFRCFISSGENYSYWYLGSTPVNTTGVEQFGAHITSLRVSNVGSFGNRCLADYEVYITPRFGTPSIQAFSNKSVVADQMLKCGYVINGANVDWYIVATPWATPFYVSYLSAPIDEGSEYPFRIPERLTGVEQEPANFVYGETIVASNISTISAGTNGWSRDSATGFTIQWGEVSLAPGTQTVIFPRTFTACYNVVSDVVGDTSHYENPYISDITTQGFKAGRNYGNHSVKWIATGIS